ncbi:MAG TPA: hypothetical protein VN969_03515 [Streptosporangiaceae bacterium]|nr:hypothetical protein [Streptosporangiaceae bacterium]
MKEASVPISIVPKSEGSAGGHRHTLNTQSHAQNGTAGDARLTGYQPYGQESPGQRGDTFRGQPGIWAMIR